MRRTDLERLEQPYLKEGTPGDKRFFSAIGADVPHADELTNIIYSSLCKTTFGIPVFGNLPVQERILISDYLYQCVSSIEVNLSEAKIHCLEWLSAMESLDAKMRDFISLKDGRLTANFPISSRPIDDLPKTLETIHVCGFFRAVGSALDCLGAAIVGVLGLSTPLRHADIGRVRNALSQTKDDHSAGRKIQIEFGEFLEEILERSGPTDWYTWTNQYRNLFVHRGRRITINHFGNHEIVLYDGKGQQIPRVKLNTHLGAYPDRSEIEAFVLGSTTVLNEPAEVTINGVFASTRDFLEGVCERLVSIWHSRQQDHSLISQPIAQWGKKAKECLFQGYKPLTAPPPMDTFIGNPAFVDRLAAASAMDHQRQLWSGSKWIESEPGDN